MKQILAFVCGIFVMQYSFGLSLIGTDDRGSACEVFISDMSDKNVLGEDVYFTNIQFSDYSYNGLFAKKTSDSSYEIENRLIRSGYSSYNRDIGSPITVGGVGVLKIEANLNLGEVANLNAKLTGESLFSWYQKNLSCSGLQAR